MNVGPRNQDEETLRIFLQTNGLPPSVSDETIKRVVKLAKEKFHKGELRRDQLLHVRTLTTQAKFDERLYKEFIDPTPVGIITPKAKRFSHDEIRQIECVVNHAILDDRLKPEELHALQDRLAILAKSDYRLQHAYEEVMKLESCDPKNDSAFLSFIKTYVPLAKQLIGLVTWLKEQFTLYTTTHNHAWNQQKYDIALNELRDVLKEIDHTSENPHFNEVFHALRQPEDFSDAQARYRHMMINLRKALTTCTTQEDKAILNEVCRARFLSVNLHVFGKSMVENMVAAGLVTVEEHTKPELKDQLKAMESSPRNLSTYIKVQIGKAKATINYLFDPHIQSNLPHHQLDFQLDGRTIQMIGMGTPTIEMGRGAVVNPEFAAFIAQIPDGECHLYINLQNNAPKLLIGDESARVNALTAFSQTSGDKMQIVTLAQDSRFYHQKDAYASETLQSDIFVRQFRTLMQSGQEGYKFPEGLNKAFWDVLEADLNAYCTLLFGEKVELTPDDRRAFIELAYPVIIHHLLAHYKATTMNITCKDGIDRGGKCQGLFIQYLANGEESGWTQERKELMADISLARAPIVKAQPMIGSRRDRFLKALQVIDSNERASTIKASFWKTKRRPEIILPHPKEEQKAIRA